MRGQNALMWAAAAKHPDAVRALIEGKADIHARSKAGYTGFLFAAQQGDLASAKLFLAAGADVNEATSNDGSALVLASASGNEELAIYLLNQGADPNAKDDSGVTALHYAMLRGLSAVDTIRYDGANPIARRPSMYRLINALIAHGADVNARLEKIPRLSGRRGIPEMFSVIGATPYMMAAASYDAPLMRLMVAHGADPKAVAKLNTTPLMFAAGLNEGVNYWEQHTAEEDRKALECVKLAIELGADVNATTASGDTALHGAAYTGSTAIIQYLVDHGAKIDPVDAYGQTPLVVAERLYAPKMVINVLRPQYVHRGAADLLIKLGAQLPEWAVKQKAGVEFGVGRAGDAGPSPGDYSKSGASADEPNR
jgi:ankyrin repeat protein